MDICNTFFHINHHNIGTRNILKKGQESRNLKRGYTKTTHRTFSYLIFVTGTTGGACGEKICHVGKFSPQDRLSCGEIFHMTNCQSEKCLHTVDKEKYGEKSVMWRHFFTSRMWTQICFVTIHAVCREICFVAIYAVFLRKIFCCYLRAFVWRKIELKIVLVEKNKTNIRYADTD